MTRSLSELLVVALEQYKSDDEHFMCLLIDDMYEGDGLFEQDEYLLLTKFLSEARCGEYTLDQFLTKTGWENDGFSNIIKELKITYYEDLLTELRESGR
ncbi:hypothetical protein D3C85_1339240 [compost metagenome]